MAAVLGVYDRVVDPDLYVRRVNIAAVGLIPENDLPEDEPEQLCLFTDYDALAAEAAADDRERRIQEATVDIQSRYGKNAILKGINLLEGATSIERNQQIGGHRSGEE